VFSVEATAALAVSPLRADFLRRRLRRPDGSGPSFLVVDSLAKDRPDAVASEDELGTTVLPCSCFTQSVAALPARPDCLSPASDAPTSGVSPSRRSFTVCPVMRGEQEPAPRFTVCRWEKISKAADRTQKLFSRSVRRDARQAQA
jgi:hypothetical protein